MFHRGILKLIDFERVGHYCLSRATVVAVYHRNVICLGPALVSTDFLHLATCIIEQF